MSKDHTKYCFTFFLFILSAAIITPQKNKIKFEHLSIEHGLSQSTVYDILQDEKGFLWFCTMDGLNRYDGYKFKVYRNDPNDITSISDNVILTIFEDKSGFLWIGTRAGGLNKFDPGKEQFSHYKYNPVDTTSLCSNWVLTICEDDSENLWIGTNGGGLSKLDRNTQRFIHYKFNPNDPLSISNNRVSSICKDDNGVIWIGTWGGGLNKYDAERNHFTSYQHNPDVPSSISNNGVNTVFKDKSGVLWIGTNSGGLNRFDEEQEQFISYKYDSFDSRSTIEYQVMTIFEDKDNNFWIGTWDGGLKRFDSEKKNLAYIKYNPDDASSISSDIILSIHEDNSGVLWFGTVDGGLNKYDNGKSRFQHNKHTDKNSLSHDDVLAFCEDDSGSLWIGTEGGGLNKYDTDNDEFIHFKHNPNDPFSISSNTINAILEDKDGVLWFATTGGLNSFKLDKQHFIKYNEPASLNYFKCVSLYEDRAGLIWIGTEFGLYNYDKKKKLFNHYNHNNDDLTSLSSEVVTSFCEDKDGILWIGSWYGGLNRFDKDQEQFIHFTHDPNNYNSLSNNHVRSILEDKSGTLWIGTNSGLNKFDKEKEIFTHFREAEGLPNDVIYGILEDIHGNLWLSTNKGISKFNPKTELFRNYDVRDGIQGNEFSTGAYYKTKSGKLLFGGINGFTQFHPDSLRDNFYIPPIVITDFKLFNKSVKVGFDSLHNRAILKKSISKTEDVELTHEDYVFTFEFAALDYRASEKNKYAYMMKGFDKDWTYTDANRRFATYTNLDPGEYTFRVKGSNNDGVWNEEGAAISVIILPPWWMTNWAYLFYTIIILGSIYFLWKTQMRKIRLKQEIEMSKFEAKKLQEVDEMKSRFFANISHEFRTPLTLILGPVKEFINNEKDKKKKAELSIVYRSADRLNGLVNQLLDLSKLEVGRMTLQTSPVHIIPLLKGLVLSFASLAERKKIQLLFNSKLSELEVYLDKDKFEKIINNILSNAFKFTPENGNVEVNVGTTAESVEIKITDTGIGIAENRLENIFNRFYQVDASQTREQEGTGIGLALTKELVELHKGKIEVESAVRKGTTFTVTLPLGKEHLKSEEIGEEMEEEEKILSPADNIIPESELQEEKLNIEVYTETEKPLVLIVEDNTDVRNYIRGYLDKEYRLLEAKDGEEGLVQSFEHVPDLIVSDVMMPKMDGFLLCEKLKTDDRTSHIPVILLTAKASGQDKIEGLETGADDYIMKPFDAKELLIRIKNLIEQRKKIIEHFKKLELFETSNLKITSRDKKFISKAIEIINVNISDENFGVNTFAKEIGLSRVQLHRKLSALMGRSSSDLIRIIRLNKAAKLIQNNFGNISEVALEIGFNNPANFAKAFRAHFGVSPSVYKKDSSV